VKGHGKEILQFYEVVSSFVSRSFDLVRTFQCCNNEGENRV